MLAADMIALFGYGVTCLHLHDLIRWVFGQGALLREVFVSVVASHLLHAYLQH